MACSQAGALPGVLEQLGARPGVDAELFDPGDASACATALERAVSRSGTRQPGELPWSWDDSAQRLVAAWRAAAERAQ